jgi:hypothetical protein
MKITVSPQCKHEDGYTSSGMPFTGHHAIVSSLGVWIDGEQVIWRDRRAIKNRTPGHPWLTGNGNPDSKYRNIVWTTFHVDVEP